MDALCRDNISLPLKHFKTKKASSSFCPLETRTEGPTALANLDSQKNKKFHTIQCSDLSVQNDFVQSRFGQRRCTAGVLKMLFVGQIELREYGKYCYNISNENIVRHFFCPII